MVGESNQNVFLVQIYTSSFAEFEISEFEIARVDGIRKTSTRAPYHGSDSVYSWSILT